MSYLACSMDFDAPLRLLSTLDSIYEQQRTLLTQNHNLEQQNATLISQNEVLSARVSALELKMSAKTTCSDCSWICPVCKTPFLHRESFKGHIRRLRDPISTSAHCFLDENNPEHQRLVSHPRYGTGTFDDRRHQFAEQFYDTVRSHSSSRHSSQSSHRAVGFCFEDNVDPFAIQHSIELCFRFMSGWLVDWWLSKMRQSRWRSIVTVFHLNRGMLKECSLRECPHCILLSCIRTRALC
jgi:hypothetical protein